MNNCLYYLSVGRDSLSQVLINWSVAHVGSWLYRWSSCISTHTHGWHFLNHSPLSICSSPSSSSSSQYLIHWPQQLSTLIPLWLVEGLPPTPAPRFSTSSQHLSWEFFGQYPFGLTGSNRRSLSARMLEKEYNCSYLPRNNFIYKLIYKLCLPFMG